MPSTCYTPIILFPLLTTFIFLGVGSIFNLVLGQRLPQHYKGFTLSLVMVVLNLINYLQVMMMVMVITMVMVKVKIVMTLNLINNL